MSKRISLDKFKKEVLSDKKSKKLYHQLEAEYLLYYELIAARKLAGLTQEEVAKKMGTSKPNIARLEGNPSDSKPSPTLKTLQKYAAAVNCHVEIRLIAN